MELNICHLYPDILNLYGDRGNIITMKRRMEDRGIKVNVEGCSIGETLDANRYDIFFIGGGQDFEQEVLLKDLGTGKAAEIRAAVEDEKTFLAICGGYQLLGNYYKTDQGMIKGLELVDMYTEQGEGRLISNIILQSELFDMPVVGFENHGGRTFIGENKPLGKVLYGSGNDGKTGYEGVVYKNVIGTYLHGPLLPKNPQLADWLVARALEQKYHKPVELSLLDDSEEAEANAYVYHRFVKSGQAEE